MIKHYFILGVGPHCARSTSQTGVSRKRELMPADYWGEPQEVREKGVIRLKQMFKFDLFSCIFLSLYSILLFSDNVVRDYP